MIGTDDWDDWHLIVDDWHLKVQIDYEEKRITVVVWLYIHIYIYLYTYNLLVI
jgi:hypothetical protein